MPVSNKRQVNKPLKIINARVSNRGDTVVDFIRVIMFPAIGCENHCDIQDLYTHGKYNTYEPLLRVIALALSVPWMGRENMHRVNYNGQIMC